MEAVGCNKRQGSEDLAAQIADEAQPAEAHYTPGPTTAPQWQPVKPRRPRRNASSSQPASRPSSSMTAKDKKATPRKNSSSKKSQLQGKTLAEATPLSGPRIQTNVPSAMRFSSTTIDASATAPLQAGQSSQAVAKLTRTPPALGCFKLNVDAGLLSSGRAAI